MTNTLVNKNPLIPLIEISENLDVLTQKLLDLTYNMDNSFCFNVYIVSGQGIYFSKNNKLFNSHNGLITEITKHSPLKQNFDKIKSFLFEDTVSQITTSMSDVDMSINIKEKKHKNIIIKEKAVKTEQVKKIQSKEELEIMQLIEETMEIYQKEVHKIKDIEKQIKVLDDNKKSLLKKKREKLLTSFSKLKNDYDSYKKIKRKRLIKSDFDIPSLFVLKNNYFTQLLESDENKKILDKIDELDLDQVLNQGNELDADIVELVNRYCDESKKLNVKFDHSWEDLELETEATEKNNSRLAGF